MILLALLGGSPRSVVETNLFHDKFTAIGAYESVVTGGNSGNADLNLKVEERGPPYLMHSKRLQTA